LHIHFLSTCARSVVLTASILLVLPVAGSAQQQSEERVTPQERQMWRSIANARFLTGDVKGALDALNQIDEPRVGTIKIEGLVRTDRKLVTEYLGLETGELFTAEKLSRLDRRINELPAVSHGKVRYDPIDGRAIVRPVVYERDFMPSGLMGWSPVGAVAVVQQEIKVDISDAMGWGEVWSPSLRVAKNRPRAVLRLSAPAPGRLPGIIRFETLAERQTYESPALGGVFRENRFRTGVALSDWLTSWLRWEGGSAVDHVGSKTYLALEGNLNVRTLGDRLALIMTGGQWYAAAERDSFTSKEFVANFRSTPEVGTPLFTTVAGVASTSAMAPLAIWPAASSGTGRGILLRAHPLQRDGIAVSEVLGRRVWFMSSEYVHPVTTPFGGLGIAGFVDVAQAMKTLNSTTSPLHVDVGAGVRATVTRSGNKVRLDLGYGLRDGRLRLSAGYVVPWGTR
jgi:hypothetical protein